MRNLLFNHLSKLADVKSHDDIDYILRTLWNSRKVGLNAAEKEHIMNLLHLSSPTKLDPVIVCLRSLIRKCVYENLKEDELLKLFPSGYPSELQGLLVVLLLKLQSEWREDVNKEQSEWPRTRSSSEISRSFSLPTPPSLQMPSVSPSWPRVEDKRHRSNRVEIGLAMQMLSGISNSARMMPPQLHQDDMARDSSPVSIPRLKAMTWSMENQNSMPANRVAIINLKLQDYSKPSSGEIEIKFQLTKDTLEAMLRSMCYIRDQLSNAAQATIQNGPVLKKARQ
eukprot:TRINITY_DN15901_c0_g1_i1.p1 TRINITY_DN15901_c0_g1~~TRINITY_DN15901_c0_g1_i1.p1  ORF type:complete len:282 (+),score=52.37 TRINITY_DN15901_c0_g1_i1:251-1096(+)